MSVPQSIHVAPRHERSHTLAELAARWEAARHPTRATVRMMQRATHDLGALSHVSHADALTRGHLRAFHDDLLRHHPRPTARKMFGLVHALLRFGYDADWMGQEPSAGMSVTPAGTPPRHRPPFTPGELTRIFSHPVFTAHAIPRASSAGGIAAYWLPLMLLCNGARLGEAAAVRASDFLEADGTPGHSFWRVPACKVRPDPNPRPVHPILIQLGLPDYVRSLPPGSDLFPLLTGDQAERRLANFSSYFSRILRHEVGIVEAHKSLASLRTTFIVACREAEVPFRVADDAELRDRRLAFHVGDGPPVRKYFVAAEH